LKSPRQEDDGFGMLMLSIAKHFPSIYMVFNPPPAALMPRRQVGAARGLAVKTDDAQSAAAEVLVVLPQVMDAMRLAMRSQLDGPLTVPQFRGLNFIDRHPGSSVSALAGFLGVTLATASAMAHRLVLAGHLQARGSLNDRRRTELQLCASGKALLERMRSQTQSDLARALQDCTPTQLSALVQGLGVLSAAFPRLESPDVESL
jgi:DNA-binding MarR family transcriptional regulator